MRFKMLIDGEWTDASEGETWAVINPATEKKVADVPFGGADEASRAISAAESALPRWKAMTAYERGKILRDIADAIRAQVDQLAPIMTAECGKPLGEATGEWGACADLFDWFAEEGKRAYGARDPRAQAGQAPAVASATAGCSSDHHCLELPGIFAGAQMGRGAGGRLRHRWTTQRADADERYGAGQCDGRGRSADGVVNLINGDPQAMGDVIMSDPRIRKVSFTGSQRVGQILMRKAAQGIKKLGMELGGSAPVLVFADSDIAWAAQLGVWRSSATTDKFASRRRVSMSNSRRWKNFGLCPRRDRETGGRQWYGRRRDQWTDGQPRRARKS